jgi:hypothetical protein
VRSLCHNFLRNSLARARAFTRARSFITKEKQYFYIFTARKQETQEN